MPSHLGKAGMELGVFYCCQKLLNKTCFHHCNYCLVALSIIVRTFPQIKRLLKNDWQRCAGQTAATGLYLFFFFHFVSCFFPGRTQSRKSNTVRPEGKPNGPERNKLVREQEGNREPNIESSFLSSIAVRKWVPAQKGSWDPPTLGRDMEVMFVSSRCIPLSILVTWPHSRTRDTGKDSLWLGVPKPGENSYYKMRNRWNWGHTNYPGQNIVAQSKSSPQ